MEGAGEFDIFDVLHGGEAGTLGQAITATTWQGIDLIPSSESLARMESESMLTPEMRLRRIYGEQTNSRSTTTFSLICLPPSGDSHSTASSGGQVLAVTEPAAF